jgi:hypothetical protein
MNFASLKIFSFFEAKFGEFRPTASAQVVFWSLVRAQGRGEMV